MRWISTLLCGVALLAVPLGAGAQDDVGYRGWGPRMGAALDPDQVQFGAHLDLGQFAERIRVEPNVEVGLGQERTLVSFNADLAYQFFSDWGRWTPYAGGGLGLNVVNYDRPSWVDGGSDTSLGLSALGGIQKTLTNGDRFFLEAKVGLVNAPDLKFLVGWTFFSHGR